jgi:hypothetical protein
MTCDKNTVTRSNFASRLLSKAMSERGKTGENRKPAVGETESFAPPMVVESQQTAASK